MGAVYSGSKAVRFVLCNHSNLKYGARFIHSVLGENSTVSCCETLHNLVFPSHEQHHNNSFLIASLVMGQSNIAAGANLGSNHNSRANDGEILAGRGFWAGLSVSLKHSSRFASFVLIQKGSYPAELNIPLPFSLVMNNEKEGRLEVMPAYWWMHNLYALRRNEWKYKARDKRKRKVQHIEYDALAPDTVEEIFTARALLEEWAGKTASVYRGSTGPVPEKEDPRVLGRRLLAEHAENLRSISLHGVDMENSTRPVLILKAVEAYQAYKDMILYYSVKNLLPYWEQCNCGNFDDFSKALEKIRFHPIGADAGSTKKSRKEWRNLGGQIVPEEKVKGLIEDIKEGRMPSWNAIHLEFDRWWKEYSTEKLQHAFSCLIELTGGEFAVSNWRWALSEAERIQRHIAEQVYSNRKKDYENRFRQATFRSLAEQEAVLGVLAENPFVKLVEEETREFCKRVQAVVKFLGP